MYKMEVPNCLTCSSAVCDCSNAVPVVVDASASAVVITEILKNCFSCGDDKNENAFSRYGFRCGCKVGKDEDKYICDDCVSNWLKVCRNKSCPLCRVSNFASVIKNMLVDYSFSFNVDKPVFVYDGSFNELSYTQKQIEAKPYIKQVFTEFVRKNVEFYDKVFSCMEDEQLTRKTQTFFNIFNFINDTILKDSFPNMEDRDRFHRFFILKDEPEFMRVDGLNSLELYDFMGDADDFQPLNETFFVMVNSHYDRWEQYRFSFETIERIDELIDDNIVDSIHYHNLDTIIEYLRPDVRDAFGSQSHFWEFARENEMTDEIIALIHRNSYHDYLRDSMEFVNYVFMNGDSGYFDLLNFDDHNAVFDDNEITNESVYFCMEFMEAINIG